MEKGIVKWFNTAKGFGFIKRLNGEDVFVHARAIMDSGYRNPSPGDNVQFEVEKRAHGLRAYRVVRISF